MLNEQEPAHHTCLREPAKCPSFGKNLTRAPKKEANVTIKVGCLVTRSTNSLEYAANRSTSWRSRNLIVRAQHGEISFAASANSASAEAVAGARHDLSRMKDMWITPALAFK
jgi:hypothetical protein